MSFQRSVIITGGTINLGFHTALNIARKHPDYLVVLSSRTDPENATETINAALGQKNTIFIPIDLSSLDNVRKFALDWSAANRPPIQALLLNAGVQLPGPVKYSSDGVELTFAINHLGHALLFHLLVPHLAPESRITITSSGTHDPAMKSGLGDPIYNSAEEIAHPTPKTAQYDGRQRYGTSKLTNILWEYALDRRLKEHLPEKGITVNAFDPGLMIGTGLLREGTSIERFMWHKVLPRATGLLKKIYTPNIHSPEESGVALATVAMGDETKGVSGKYFEGVKEIKSSVDSYVVEKQNDLWDWTVHFITKGDQAEASRFNEIR